jgi:S1-C subfamily serine protease
LRTTVPLIVAISGFALASCSQGAPNRMQALVNSPSHFTERVEIDRTGLKPLVTPLNIGMKPTRPVDYTYVLANPATSRFEFIAKGQISFERQSDGKLAQITKLGSGALEDPKTGDTIPLPLSIETYYEFDANGEVWTIRKPKISIPTANPSSRLTDELWAQFRKEIVDEYSFESGNPAYECAGQVFGLNGQSVKSGFPMAPQNLEEFVTRISVCTLATIRGGSPVADEEYRQQLVGASPEELAEMLSDTEATYRDQFAGTLTYTSDVQIRGSVAEGGQEFLLAEGTTRATLQGVTIVSSTSSLIDPFTGLPYKARNRVTVEGSPNAGEDAKKFAQSMNGVEVAVQTELPQAVPQVVTVTEPKPVVTTSSGAGSLSDIYTKSVGAVYLVVANASMGTGFAISPSEAITAAHVVEGQDSALLQGPSGQRFRANVVARDAKRDVALLRIQGGTFPSMLRLSSDFPATGAQVAVIGCPFDPGLCGTLTTGIVSFSNRPVDGINHVQIDAAINQGNSGGPILTLNGEVIGIAEFKITEANAAGLSFGLASTEIRHFLDQQQVVISQLPANPSMP